MPSSEDIASQQALLQAHRKTLNHYLQQEAQLGSAYTSPNITHGILTARENIARIKSILKDWGITVENLPNDEMPSIYHAELVTNTIKVKGPKSVYHPQDPDSTRSSRVKIDKHPSAKHFFDKMPNLSTYISKARKIDLCGVSRLGTLHKHLDEMLRVIAKGGEIRILIVDNEDSSAIKISGLRSAINDGDYFARQIAQSKKRIEWLYENFKKLQGDKQQHTGSMEIRLLPYPPTFGISAFDVNHPEGVVFVEIFPHKSPSQSPTFKLTLQKDGEWYGYFVDQFEKMWSDAKPWSPSNSP
jgi:hypothetical protein